MAPCLKIKVNVIDHTILHAHRPIPWNQPLSYLEGILSMDFDNVTLTSQKPCQHNNRFDFSEKKQRLQHSTINVDTMEKK